jgi:diguanylate cyclase (GGDEF)-like protein
VVIRGEKGAVVGIAESFDEQGSLFERENREHHLAAHGCLDPITGVMNPALVRSYLREHLAFFTEYDLPFGILSSRIKDLPQFRAAHGREAADDILHVVAETIKHTLGTAGFLGRWTEDQFLVIVPNCSPTELNQTGDNLETSVNSSEIKWWGDLLCVVVALGRTMVRAGDTPEVFSSLCLSSPKQSASQWPHMGPRLQRKRYRQTWYNHVLSPEMRYPKVVHRNPARSSGKSTVAGLDSIH